MFTKRFLQRLKSYEQAITSSLPVFFDAHQLIVKHRFKTFLLISGFTFLLLFSFSIRLLLKGVETLEDPITEFSLPYLDKILTVGASTITKGITSLFWLVNFVIDSNKDALFASVFMIIGTPYFSYISARTEEAVTGKKYPFQLWNFIKEIKRGIALSIRNSFKQLGWLLLISLFALIPIIGVIAPLFTFVVQAYYNGLLMTDYTLERQGYSVKESQVYYRQHKPELFAIGLGLMFLLLIPVIGWFLAPTYALVAAYLNFEKTKAKVNEV
jgi:CysZ protein